MCTVAVAASVVHEKAATEAVIIVRASIPPSHAPQPRVPAPTYLSTTPVPTHLHVHPRAPSHPSAPWNPRPRTCLPSHIPSPRPSLTRPSAPRPSSSHSRPSIPVPLPAPHPYPTILRPQTRTHLAPIPTTPHILTPSSLGQRHIPLRTSRGALRAQGRARRGRRGEYAARAVRCAVPVRARRECGPWHVLYLVVRVVWARALHIQAIADALVYSFLARCRVHRTPSNCNAPARPPAH